MLLLGRNKLNKSHAESLAGQGRMAGWLLAQPVLDSINAAGATKSSTAHRHSRKAGKNFKSATKCLLGVALSNMPPERTKMRIISQFVGFLLLYMYASGTVPFLCLVGWEILPRKVYINIRISFYIELSPSCCVTIYSGCHMHLRGQV